MRVRHKSPTYEAHQITEAWFDEDQPLPNPALGQLLVRPTEKNILAEIGQRVSVGWVGDWVLLEETKIVDIIYKHSFQFLFEEVPDGPVS